MDYSTIFIPLSTLLISQAMLFNLASFRFPRKKIFLILGIEIAVLVILSSVILLFEGLPVYAKWYVPIMVIPTFFTFFYISKHRDARDLFTIVTTILINFFISTPAMWFAYTYRGGYVYYNFARIVLFAVVFFFIHTFFRKYYLVAQDEIDTGWGVFSILPFLGSMILYYGFMRYSRSGSMEEVLYVCSVTIVLMASVYAVFFYMFFLLHEKNMVQEQGRMLAMQNKAQFDQHVLFKETAEKSNRRWHDMRHNTQAIIDLLESGDTAVALGYLKDQMGMGSVPKEEYCLHPAVNSILCLWVERARKEDIPMEILVTLPKTLAIEPVELSSLFANAIENAYFSCLELAKDVQRFIKVEALYNGKRLAIGITNTCKDSVEFVDDMPVSSKEGGGIGTRSMVYTVKRFHGAYSFNAKDGLFFTRFVLNI